MPKQIPGAETGHAHKEDVDRVMKVEAIATHLLPMGKPGIAKSQSHLVVDGEMVRHTMGGGHPRHEAMGVETVAGEIETPRASNVMGAIRVVGRGHPPGACGAHHSLSINSLLLLL
jgi:hypothetical protein